jgi:hypothetical protein
MGLAVLLIALNNTDSWALIIISAVHYAIYTAIFYLISLDISHRLKTLSPSQRNKRRVVIMGSSLLMRAPPIHGAVTVILSGK